MVFDLRSARYFVAVAEELHFGRAAMRLQMSQPPLSQAIKQLERDIGAELFERSNRSVGLTPAGEAFLPACRRLIEQAQEVAELPRLVEQGFRRQLSVGAVASALRWPLPQALALLHQKAPDIMVGIHEIDTHEVVRGLGDRHLDLALARLPASRAGIRTDVILREEFVVIAPPTHPLAMSEGTVDLASLAGEYWVGITREVSPDYHDEMVAAFHASGFTPHLRHTARSIASQIAIVAAGAGVSIVPRSATRGLADVIAMRATTNRARTVALAISTRHERDRSERLLHQCIQAAAGTPEGT